MHAMTTASSRSTVARWSFHAGAPVRVTPSCASRVARAISSLRNRSVVVVTNAFWGTCPAFAIATTSSQ